MSSDSEKVYVCPSCDYTGTLSSVRQHYTGKWDDTHDGSGWDVDLEVVGEMESTKDSEDEIGEEAASEPLQLGRGKEPKPDGDSDPEPETQRRAQTGTPEVLFGSREPEHDSGRTEGYDQDPADGCPNCGAELVDYRQYEPGRYHDVAGDQHYVRGDWLCSGCNRWWVDE